jgi:hypothetical protein
VGDQLVHLDVHALELGSLFEHWTDREAIRMAAFTSADPDDRGAFDARWARLRRDRDTTNRVVETEGRVVGQIASFELDGQREVTYWIGRQDWGRGIATRALQQFLTTIELARPLYARAASDNAGSIRVAGVSRTLSSSMPGGRLAIEGFPLGDPGHSTPAGRLMPRRRQGACAPARVKRGPNAGSLGSEVPEAHPRWCRPGRRCRRSRTTSQGHPAAIFSGLRWRQACADT